MHQHAATPITNPADRLAFAPIFGDHMVLQRNQPVPVWGTGPEGVTATVVCLGQRRDAVVRQGRWSVMLEPLEMGAPLALQLGEQDGRGGFTVHRELTDILVGDVYLAGGQSNMEFRLRDSLLADTWTQQADIPHIRSWYCPRVPYVGAKADEPNAVFTRPPIWTTCTPRTAGNFSAVAFHFARTVHHAAGVPIGLLDANWGGSSASCWMDASDLESDPMLTPWIAEYRKLLATLDPDAYERSRDAYAAEVSAYLQREAHAVARGLSGPERDAFVGGYPWPPPNGPKNALSPCGLFHTMIAPMAPMAMAGVIWYQGETDAGIPGTPMGADKYGRLFSSMIARWRHTFAQPALPFLFVQLTSFGCDGDPDGENWPTLREQQRLVAEAVPGCAMAVIHDYGDRIDIHPKHKQPVGERLARLALHRLYGQPVLDSGPIAAQATREGNVIRVRFDACKGGLTAGSPDPLAMTGLHAEPGSTPVLNGFALCGADGIPHAAQACIEGDCVRVETSSVPDPRELRYGWTNHTLANLYNGEGLPAAPFRMPLA